ncbi:hypothetical protein MLD38_004758 [Melastoma candidum]|uniref:Uncharacterized protein n=1 Tax=Melastoma candidum TaxID=119954 RepID=A0ACB9SA11_9MYRT|nr:hypothetical protein MLD38_004758 [Melastoma candidum]
MGFWTLFQVASVPNLQVLLISLVGAFMATKHCNLLTEDARKSLNKIVFMVFTPSLMFASLAKTVTFEDIVSWWFMPVNIALTFVVGGILGWIVVKLVKPSPHLEGVVIAVCSSGNLGNLMLIIVPAICKEDGSPFGDKGICSTVGLSYASFSMALGGFFIWTYTFQLIRSSCTRYKELQAEENRTKVPNGGFDVNTEAPLLKGKDQGQMPDSDKAEKSIEDVESQAELNSEAKRETSIFSKIGGFLHQIVEELMAPPTMAAVVGFIFGAVSWLRNLIIGEGAPFRVLQESIKLLGDGTIPCITLILGGNLTKGFRSSKIGPLVVIGVLLVRYVISPAIGIWVVKAAGNLGFLPSDPLYRYVLMVQFTVPPAMNIGTMTQLFGVGSDECSVLFFWTYLVAALALTLWSTVFMWILS